MDGNKKIGRNEPCPCGSGDKFKKCHGKSSQTTTLPVGDPNSDPAFKSFVGRMKASEIQREKQQGLGRPIISNIFKGHRIVAVGNRMFWNKKEHWQTFHDFLSYYVKTLFGQEWADIELKKKPSDRHPLLIWYESLCSEQKKAFRKKGELFKTSVTGAIFAFATLAYNLYLIAHNIHLVHGDGLHARLVERLKNTNSFYPAFYETMVAASFIKAGFKIELENEEDSSSNHAEFFALSSKTKRKYSVEAKYRQMGKDHTAIRNQLYKALEKDLPHQRVIFINLNTPDNITGDGRLAWLDDVIRQIRSGEETITVKGEPAPKAYVFVTNHPFLYNLDSCMYSPAVVAEGFKIPDFKIDSGFSNLREAIDSREKHIDMFDLIRTMKEYDTIPCTFDGEIPEFAFGEIDIPRLIIGNKYIVPDASGNEVTGVLEDASVLENEKKVYGVYRTEDNKRVIATCPLSDKEIKAYRRHPDTFFGVHKKQSSKANDALDMYDFLYDTYKHSTKEKLLEFLKSHPDAETFKEMSQEELSKKYCEIMTYAAMSGSTHPSAPPTP